MSLNIKLVARKIRKDWNYLVLNFIGLSLGLSCVFAVMIWVKNEFSYDKHLSEANRIFRLTFETNVSGNRLHFARCWEPWVSQMPESFPQIEELVRLAPFRHTAVKADLTKIYSDRVFATDSNFFSVFDIGLLQRGIVDVLGEPYSAVLSSSFAKKLFKDSDPVGKTILLSGEYDEKMIPYTVKGIMKDSPVLSHIHFDVLTSFTDPKIPPSWAYIYLMLKPNTNPDDLLSGFPAFIKEVENNQGQVEYKPYLQKITDIHLHSSKDREIETNSNIAAIYLFISIAVIILLISLVNFYNLNKARLPKIEKQTHIQLIAGSDKRTLSIQSLLESGFCVTLSFAAAIILLCSGRNAINSYLGLNIIPGNIFALGSLWPLVIFILFISVLSGSWPMIYHLFVAGTGLNPDMVPSHSKSLRSWSYGLLMTVQFFLALILMISTIVIYRQNRMILATRLGKMDNSTIVFKKLNWECRLKYKTIKEKSLQSPLISDFSATMEEPTGETLDAMNIESPAIESNFINKPLFVLSVDDNFLEFFNIPLVAGRNFSPYNPDRKGEDYILNETAVKHLGLSTEGAIGKPFRIIFNTPDIFYGGTIVGVVRDFKFNTIHQEVKPYVLFQKPIFYLTFFAEINPYKKTDAINYLEEIWKEVLPEYPFQYEYLSDLYNTSYRKEITQSKLTIIFSLLSLIIICMGLYTVTSVIIAGRAKEIGIRKVNGARVPDIMITLSSDFVKWFIIAFTIACPTAWVLMEKWLQSFVYKTDLKWWFLIVSGLLIFIVALTTLSFQTRKAALRNPVESLRYE